MTRDDMRKALDLIEDRRQYLAAIEYNNRTTNYVNTEKIYTGIGDCFLNIAIPWSNVEAIMEDRITDIETWLGEHGVEYNE
jgi:hypothetical protein